MKAIEPTEAVIRVETTPPGATVWVDGDDRGKTPLELHLPIGDTGVLLELRRRGHTTHRQTVLPDADQRVTVTLRKKSAKPDDGGRSGFRRFD